ncbi:hypothetical protein Glove_365g52 [Diversispora epigaea]|uniref:DNA 3'-5' helicase n=1 Tax=Diversispora epigaea TaxID=1348612 RepID=A0A397HBW0_9GLOM|nr:hypothetical protein Glove_365g52 [Diversispora epigaea]
MNKSQWFETLLSSNNNYKLYSRANGSHLIMDTTTILQVLDIHSQHIDIIYNNNATYYHIKVSEEKMWVPILPGFTIFTNVKNNIYQLSIGDFSKIIASNTQSDRFQSLLMYINCRGKISIPYLLGFNIPGIKIIKVVQRKAKRLHSELEDSSPTLIREGFLVATGETKYVNYEDFMILLIENKQIKQQLYNANRQIKCLKQKLDKFKREQNEKDDDENGETLISCINNIIKDSKLGSTILISTEQFLSLILQQSCNYCGEACFPYKKSKVSTMGFSVRISIICKSCETYNEFTNELLGLNFNQYVATAGLVGGTNRRSLQMVFSCVGITLQLGKVIFYQRQAFTFGEIIKAAETISFDCSWSHVRNAQQASGEIIYDGRDVEGYSYKPIIAFHVVEKTRKTKTKDGNERIIRKGNFDLSSRQMEHAILIALIEKLTCTLEEQDILLNITIDGDLDSNKTLGNVGIINQIFADLKHLTKNIHKNLKKYTKWQEFEQHIMNYFSACIYTAGLRKTNEENCNLQEKDIRYIQIEGLLQHLCNNHDLCWPEVCWIKQNPEIQLREPTLQLYTNTEHNQFKTMLEFIFKLPFGQGIGTTTRTSQNEAFNRVKLVYTSKLIDYPVSYQSRHALAILHNNEGICEILRIARQVYNIPLSHQDLLNISKIKKEHDQHRINNIGRIEKRNAERAFTLQNLRNELDSFDWDQELVAYSKKTQEQIGSNSFQPSFSTLIPDFNEKTKCIACHSFPKCTARGLCRIICKSALEGIFQFSEFRNGQKEAIQSFIKNKDTFVLKQTGGGKSIALASVIVSGITIVFSPLKALVDDQVSELIKVGIPCCGLYASTAQPIHYQQKVFQKIACGLIRVIITTPEKFKFNIGFQKMLERIGNTKGIRFVIDEAHCILDQEHFRDSWNYLYNLKKIFPAVPILLLIATCQIVDIQEITLHNKEQFLNDILKIINEIKVGKCIIYCITIKRCEELLTNLQGKVSKEIISIYHGELSAKEKSNTLLLWKMGKIRIIVATNAFGMGINEPDVRAVIHAGFPISIGNLVQESGRAGRDGLPAKAIVFFNRKDIKTVMGVYMGGQESTILENEVAALNRIKYLSDAKCKIREVLFYCSTLYQCRKQIIINYFTWLEDSTPQECQICDNCIRRIVDNPIYVDIQSDMKKMLEVIDKITKTEYQITKNNIIDVFRQSQAKDIKDKFGSLKIYQEKFARKLKTKEEAFLLLDDLILRKLVEEDIILNRSSTGQTYSCSIFIFGIVENALEKANGQNWNYFIKIK